MEADLDHDGKISFEEFTKMVENTDVSMSMTLGMLNHSLVDPLSKSTATAADKPPPQTNSRQRPHSDTRRTKFARRFERDIGWLLGNRVHRQQFTRKRTRTHFFAFIQRASSSSSSLSSHSWSCSGSAKFHSSLKLEILLWLFCTSVGKTQMACSSAVVTKQHIFDIMS